MIDLGDRMTIFTVVLDQDGTPVVADGADPAITLEVRSPTPGSDGEWTDITSSITLDEDADLGDGTTGPQYSALFTPDVDGTWSYRWMTFGTFVGVDYAQFVVVDHASDHHPTWTIEGYQIQHGLIVPDADVPRVDMAIKLAAAYVQRRTGQRIELVEDDEVMLDGNGNHLLFVPEIPLVDVVELVVDGETWIEGTDFDYSTRRGTLVALGRRWPLGQRNVLLTYSHGYAEMPVDIQAVVYGIAKRAVDNPSGTAIRSETLGSYSVAFEALTGGLTSQEADILDLIAMPNQVTA